MNTEFILAVCCGISLICLFVAREVSHCKAQDELKKERQGKREYERDLWARWVKAEDENWKLNSELRALKEENAEIKQRHDSLAVECARMAEYIDKMQGEVSANEG